MFLSNILLVVSLTLNFLYNIHVDACDTNCTDKPVLTPSRVVVKHGGPVAATCSVCEDCLDFFGLEVPLGQQNENRTTISWKAQKMTEWDPAPFCYYTKKDSDHQCCTFLPITVYQPPDNVSISFKNQTMFEGHQYSLQCEVQKVAPIKNLIVTLYRGQTALDQKSYNDTKNKPKPVTKTFIFNITTSKDDDGAQYWCEAKLELGPEGPQPPPVVTSQKITASVHYEPQLHGSSHSEMTIKAGSPLLLNCSAWGNPSPSYRWTLPSGSPHSSSSDVLTIESVTSADEGLYTCSVSNSRGTVTVEFKVTVEAVNIILIIMPVVVVAVLVCLSALVYWRCYRTRRMGKYTLKDVFRLSKQHTAVPITE